ncbi:MAG: LytTR family DNA-binding domain-containing protein [Acidobacteriota bacterium]|nr:LytTR family DNA-binding domain-containing protein [Acidobacteriota bacterium]
MISAVITDDELLARHKLGYLLRGEPDVQVLGEATSGAELIELAKLTRPDIIFLDVQMAGMDGFDAVSALSVDTDWLPRVIFTTAYDKYAVRAFELNAVDYLLKPYTKERFQEALNRVRHHLSASNVAPRENSRDDQRDRLIFKTGGRIIFLPLHEICFISAEENYVRLVTSTESHLLRDTLSNFEKRLDPKRFLRIHRSTILNLRYIREMRSDGPRGELHAIMANGIRLPVSRGFRSRVTELVIA